MYGLILTLHVTLCLGLAIVILIQSGKSGGLGGLFGGGNEALFSAPSGTLFIKKVTAGLAIGFICTTLILTILHSHRTTRSVLQRVAVPQSQR
ncbi:MAG: preprotein translocase subunit SecG [Elusimicrobia bacterium]|nr:preprotein translocase subunit SecG [Elusimicrobiota bacterium]MBI3013303.1 preprotein translocase subunit SecG [Elusimicrobiota bacterium]